MECLICMDEHAECLKCQCGSTYCFKCVKESLLSTNHDPCCPNVECRREWDREFQYEHLGAKFVNGEYRQYRKQYLLERQMSMMPDTLMEIERRKLQAKQELNMRIYNMRIRKLREKQVMLNNSVTDFNMLDIGTTASNKLIDKIILLKSEIKTLQTKIDAGIPSITIEHTVETSNPLVCPCPRSDCRGFIIKRTHKCGICETKICRHCREPAEAEHKCDPETVETIKLLKQDTKSCPKCATQIFKVDGCDQMWCPQCKVAFSWKTGKIEKGHIHNPHYYQYMRATGQHIERNPLDVPAGECHADPFHLMMHQFQRLIRMFDDNYILHLYRMYQDMYEHKIIYNQKIEELRDTTEIRIQYLENKISKSDMANVLMRRDNMIEKKKVIYDLIDVVCTVMTDTFLLQTKDIDLRIPDALQVLHTKIQEHRQQLFNILDYANEQLEKCSKNYQMKCPVFTNEPSLTHKSFTHDEIRKLRRYIPQYNIIVYQCIDIVSRGIDSIPPESLKKILRNLLKKDFNFKNIIFLQE
jgi:hypothetical protein